MEKDEKRTGTAEDAEMAALEAQLVAAELRRVERGKERRKAEMLERLEKLRWDEENDALEAELAEAMPDRKLGIHYDYLRFGSHLVAFQHQRLAHDAYVKKLPDKGQVAPSESRNYVIRCLIRIDGEELGKDGDMKRRGELFDPIAAEFGGATNTIANVLLELAKGGTSARAGK